MEKLQGWKREEGGKGSVSRCLVPALCYTGLGDVLDALDISGVSCAGPYPLVFSPQLTQLDCLWLLDSVTRQLPDLQEVELCEGW